LRPAQAPNAPVLISPAAEAAINAPAGVPTQIFTWDPPASGPTVVFYRMTFENADNPASFTSPVIRVEARAGRISTQQIIPPALASARIRWSVRACNNERTLQKTGDDPGACSQPASRILVWSRSTPQSGSSSGSSARARTFRQYVIASARLREDLQSPQDFLVQIQRSTDRTTWSAATLSDGLLFAGSTNLDAMNGPPEPCGTAIKPSMGSSPGIGSNGRFYVLAFWGRPQTAGSAAARSAQLFVATSQDSVSWTWPVRVHTSTRVWDTSVTAHPTLGRYVVPSSGVSVASQGYDGPWFAAFADSSGAINIVALPIRPSDGAVVGFTAPSTGICDVLRPSPVSVIAGVTTNVAPALAQRESRLVLGWQAQGQLRLLTTTDGRAWPHGGLSTPGTERTSGQPLTARTNSAPFLHFSTGPSLLLTLTESYSTPARFDERLFSGRLRVLSSVDGASFTQISEYGVPNPDQFGSAVAARVGAFVVTYPSYAGGGRRTALFLGPAPAEQEIRTDTPYRATIAVGP
jgi:hypothetical protein